MVSPTLTEKRLLVVDDEPELAEFVQLVADGIGFEVEVAENADAFKRAFETFRPTTIVMDIVMPDVSGIDLVKWLIDRGCGARVIVASGMNSVYGTSIMDLAEDGGLRLSLLNKPFRLEALRRALQAAE